MRGSSRATSHKPPGTAEERGTGNFTAAAADVWGRDVRDVA